MVYRRFGSVYSRLLLSKQDELRTMEATLLAMDRTDLADDNEHYLMSRSLDVERDRIPEAWNGVSRVVLLERMEKVALEYGMYCDFRTRLLQPYLLHPGSFRVSHGIVCGALISRLRIHRGREDHRRSTWIARRWTLPLTYPSPSQQKPA